MREDEISSLIRKKISPDGTLTLDREQTELLIRWLTRVEMTLSDYERTSRQLEELLRRVK